MIRGLLALAVSLGLVAVLLAVPAPNATIVYINLQSKANHKLKDNFHSNTPGNNLAELPQGEQKLAGLKFKIGERLIQLGSQIPPDKPEKVEGISVGRKFVKLHILHATGYGGGPNKEGSKLFVPDDTLIGKYIIHYEDKTKETIEIVYGKDVRDWFFTQEEKGVARGQVAWEGENDRTKEFNGVKLRLYLTTWKNPKPDKKVVSIDYISTKSSNAAPFCVAMTAETK